jgi:uncharacterized protein (DUF433 family)
MRDKELEWRDRIESDPQILRGKPCIKGTRIPAALILGYLASGKETPQILEQFPDITASDVAACLDFARDLADFEATAYLYNIDGRLMWRGIEHLQVCWQSILQRTSTLR